VRWGAATRCIHVELAKEPWLMCGPGIWCQRPGFVRSGMEHARVQRVSGAAAVLLSPPAAWHCTSQAQSNGMMPGGLGIQPCIKRACWGV
jgi:hypothetical protein